MTQQTFPQVFFNWMLEFRNVQGVEPNNPVIQFLDHVAKNMSRSKSQLFQDLFVTFCKRGKRGGFFVEFGATNGVTLSNSYLLEKEYGWKGILAEPAKDWHVDLKKNRRAIIDTRCVWKKTGERLQFKETEYGELSTLLEFQDKDSNRGGRQAGKIYEVETITLNDLLELHKAPTHMDFLSIDTEGSELDILTAFNFLKYRFDIMCVEHNYTEDRPKLRALLESKGYVNVFSPITQYDDWYLHNSMIEKLSKR
jgi:FkbM family methyltransferase